MEEFSCNHKWLFTEEELTNTPSVRAGITLEQELTFRQKQAMLIQTIGLKSGLTQLAVNTSVIFMHRFFMFRTVKAFPRVQLALGFAFAGGKVEESARKLENLIRTAVEVIRHNRNREFLDKSDPLTYEMDCQWRSKIEALCQNNCNIESAAYLEMRKLVLECETEIYGVIGFQLQIVHPHNFVIRMCALLGAENIKDISQYAYNLATASSQLTMLCLKYDPETIATMCLNIASKAHSVRFESMKDSNVKWYQIIVPNTDFAEIEAVSEEFLHCIKGCPLLPSWMTNLARMSRVNNRTLPGPSRGPGVSTVSAPPGGRHGLPAAAASSGTAAPSSSSLPQNYPAKPQPVATSSQPPSQGSDSRQSLSSSRLPGSQSQGEVVISPNNRQSSADGGGSVVTAVPDVHSIPSSHSRPHLSGGSAQMRPPQSSSATSSGNLQHHHQQRAHPPGNGQPANQGPSPAGSNRLTPKLSQQPGSTNPQVPRPPQPQHPGSHSTSHQVLPRPAHDQVIPRQDPVQLHDQVRSHSDAVKISHDPSRHRDQPRPHEPIRSQEPLRHNHGRPEHRGESSVDSKRKISQPPEPSSHRSQTSRTEHTLSQYPSEVSPHTPPISPADVKSLSPQSPDISQLPQISVDSLDASINVNLNSSSESIPLPQSQLESHKRSLANQGPRLSLTMYRERASTKSRTPLEQSSAEETNISVTAADETYAQGLSSESVTDSPAGVSMRHNTSNSDLINFSKPQDSPNNPRIKIKVKRDPSSGERHAVKYADTGIKIKIKPIRSETVGSAEGAAGPSGLGLSSTSSTPREEGEIVEDTPPSSGDSEQKSERLKIRLSVPKSDHGSSFSRREGDQGSNGHNGERESSHRSHHHSHHRSHHHSKSKKHSKHDRSRHEGKSSSKRSASAVDYYEERPSKTSRSDTHTMPGGDAAHRLAGYSEFSSSNSSSRTLQQQNSGFSINDAFSSTMPHNIFNDDEDDPTHSHPPITPTADAMPPHHERFHQLMAQHRARLEATMKPPLPKGPPPPPSSPPPPPPAPPLL